MARVVHGFPPVIDANCRILILGSFPSVRSRAGGFYYLHPRNRFWRILEDVFGVVFAGLDRDERRNLLLAHGIALADVVDSCEIEGSADATIRAVVPLDVAALIAGTKIDRILLNGFKAWQLFNRYDDGLVPIAWALPSTSPANAGTRYPELLASWRLALEP